MSINETESEHDNSSKWLLPEDALRQHSPSVLLNSLKVNDSKAVRYGFKIANIGLLLAQSVSTELISHFTIYPLPKTSDSLKGLINLRGNLIPVYDLKKLLLPNEGAESNYSKLLILGEQDKSVAIQLAEFPQIVSTDQILSYLPQLELPKILQPYILNSYDHQGQIWLEFDYEGFFLSITAQRSTYKSNI